LDKMRHALAGLTSRLRHLAAAAILVLAGLGGTVAPAAAYTVPNPYATGPDPADVRIGKLVVFGDSFSKLNRKSFRNWAEQLRYDELNRATGLPQVATLAGRAVSGATAGTYPGSTNDFATQVAKWLASPRSFGGRDLTVVYFGHNDLEKSADPTGADLSGAMADYRAALQRVLAAGAAGGSRRVLLVMPHDWGRSPYYVANGGSAVLRQRTQAWNALVAAEARQSSYTRLVAVDLFTAMECVFEQPARFGFTNVTAPRPSGGDPQEVPLRLQRPVPLRPPRPGADQAGGPVLPDPRLGLVEHVQGPGDGAAEADRRPRGREGVPGVPCSPAAPAAVAALAAPD
jgi:lysophospholipase L1-like esterase